MPGRNVVKEYVPEAYYHVYNRGVEKRDIFLDDQDYTVFLGLLKKFLVGAPLPETNRHVSKIYGDKVEFLAYCLMPNHFHMLFYQIDEKALSGLMRSLATAYVMYFNDRYQRVGPLFQGTFKASQILKDSYLEHITRYIHLNPDDYKEYPYSSLANYTGRKQSSWLRPQRILELFEGNSQAYTEFVEDYESTKQENDYLKWHLANDPEDT
jgi:putative transposase